MADIHNRTFPASAVSHRLQNVSRPLPRRLLPAAVLIFCLACCAGLLTELIFRFSWLGEVGSGDLYIFHTIRKFQASGVIYQRNPDEPAPVYGPMLYTLLAFATRLTGGGNPLLGPRIMSVMAFLLCVAFVVSITRALIPHARLWLWSLPLALSFPPMVPWVLQLRGDFESVMFSLISLRLVLTRRSSLALLAGAIGGFATQFKMNYIAALVAGLIWLGANRRWKALFLFAFGAALTVFGIDAFYMAREPSMAGSVTALRKPVIDLAGDIRLILHLTHEPIALLGLAVLPFVRWRLRSGWTLLALYAIISFCISSILELQVGGAENYFFEFLFGITPFAALAIVKLQSSRQGSRGGLLVLGALLAFGIAAVTQLPPGAVRYASTLLLAGIAVAGVWKRRQPRLVTGGLSLASLLAICLAAPISALAFTAARNGSALTSTHNREMRAFQAATEHKSVLSFVPGLGFFIPVDFLPDPWGLSYGEMMGGFDYHPLARRIQAQEFDLIVTPRIPDSHRGLSLLSPTLRPPIREVYQPFCSLHNWVMFLRRNSIGQEALGKDLVAMGCDPGSCLTGSYCHIWDQDGVY